VLRSLGAWSEAQRRRARRYEEWAHPYFISYQEYERIADRTGALEKIKGENWVKETITAWRHSIWVGVWDPWIVIWKGLIRGRPPPHTPSSSPSLRRAAPYRRARAAGPWIWWKVIREIVTLERMHRAFACDLMTYGMIKAKKKMA
jgi:MPBQ/MSBQ methyltransferase